MTHPKTRKMLLDEREGVGKPNRIAACMIMGDAYDHGMVCKTMASLKKADVDKVFIAYNGRSRSTLQWLFRHLKKIEMPFLIQKFKWEDDFALARNQSFSLVPKEDFDWMLWIDADDEFVIDKPLKEMFESLDEYTTGIWLRYDYASDPETGAVKLVQWRERILSTKVEWTWVHPIHETCQGPSGTQFARRDHAFVRHLRDVEAGGHESRERNRRIVSKALRESPDDARLQFYFATEVMAEADSLPDGSTEKARTADAAILAYQKFMRNEQAQDKMDDLYLAATRIGDLYLMKGEAARAVEAYLSSLKVYPDWPDAYIGLARASMMLEDWARTKAFAVLAQMVGTPSTPSAMTPTTYLYTPALLLGIAEEELGQYADALESYEEAKAVWNPPNGMLDDKIENIKRKLAVTALDKDLRKNLRGKRSDKSIAFVTAPLPEPWHPLVEEERGTPGGSEICVMKMAERFAADGWRVAVFGTPGEYRGLHEGVEWWNSNEYLPAERFKVVVGSRIPELFASEVNSEKKYLWMHDVNVGPKLYPFIDRPDAIVGVSRWHVEHLEKLYKIPKDKLRVIPNGIDLELYNGWDSKEQTDELRFIWSSSPDRGLGTLVAMWPTIKGKYPTARLDIFYGWGMIDKLIARSDRRAGYLLNMKKNILGNIAMIGGESAGIYQHGRVSQKELAKWQIKAHLWAYPTDFMETFCISAIEAQAAGVIPIASKLAALKENISCPGDLLIEGWPLNTTYQNEFLRRIDTTVDAPDDVIADLKYRGRDLAERFTWDKSYDKWNQLIGEK